MRPYTCILLLTLLISFSVTACDSGGVDGDEDDGDAASSSFSLSIDGEGIDESIEGIAFFGEVNDPETGEQAFALLFTDAQSANASQEGATFTGWFGRASNRPGTGSYTIANVEEGDALASDQFVAWMSRTAGGSTMPEVYLATGGRLQISSSSDSRIEGQFEMSATTFVRNAEGQSREVPVTIEGSFDAASSTALSFPGGMF